jgi:hypothetical protein
VIQDLYPDQQVDIELSDGENNNRQNKSAGNDAEGKRVPSIKPIAPNPTGPSMAGNTRSLVVGQIVTAPSGSKQKKTHVPLATKHKQPIPSAGQMMTHIELPPYRGPRSHLDLVAIEIVFGRLFEAF